MRLAYEPFTLLNDRYLRQATLSGGQHRAKIAVGDGDISKRASHASVTTTQIYTLVTPDTLREVYAASHPHPLG